MHGSGDEDFNNYIMIPLKARFKFRSEEEDDFLYVGTHVVQTSEQILVDQERYVDDLELPDMEQYSGISDLSTILEDQGQSDFRALVGKIGWLTNSSRPDLAYDHVVLSTILGKATIKHLRQAGRILKKIKSDGTHMKFMNLGKIDEWTLQGYGDAGFEEPSR